MQGQGCGAWAGAVLEQGLGAWAVGESVNTDFRFLLRLYYQCYEGQQLVALAKFEAFEAKETTPVPSPSFWGSSPKVADNISHVRFLTLCLN